jgi:two-component system response regulator MprA
MAGTAHGPEVEMATKTARSSRKARRRTPASTPASTPATPASVEQSALPGSAAASRSALSQIALVVDDDPAVRHLIGRILTRRGWSVVEARTAAEAIEETAARQPNLVVTDFEMPSLNGLDLARRLRAVDVGLPILMVSGHPNAAAGILDLPGGRTAFAVKPFAPDELVARVEALMSCA